MGGQVMALSTVRQAQFVLRGIDYPCTKDELVEHASEAGADAQTLSLLDDLPDREFYSPEEVSDAMSDVDDDENM
jgi:hypothetical protein